MKTALIVDDSAVARTVLGKLLAEHGVAVDEASSAEDAIDFLQAKRPDVVFLDHMMPGMDGLEALESIKTNPDTATIPIMMYTSEEGQVYLGQARALGAIGVLPKSLRPAEVKQTLRQLHLISGDGPETEPTRPAPQSIDRQELAGMLRELFYEQATMLRDEMRRLASSMAQPVQTPEPAAGAESPARQAHGGRLIAALGVIAACVSVVLAFLLFQTNTLLTQANERAAQLAQESEALADAGTRVIDTLRDEARAGAQSDGGAGRTLAFTTSFPFNSVPLNDDRALELASLFDDLRRSGFSGTALIDVHSGRFCMNYGPEGELTLAPPEQMAATCERIGSPDSTGIETGPLETIAFANMVASASRDGLLRVETVAHGSMRPIIEYPAPDYVVTAGEWNSIAAANQRISLRLLEDESGGSLN